MARVTKRQQELEQQVIDLSNQLEDSFLLIGKKEFDLQRAQALNAQLMRTLREREGGNVSST